MLVTVWSAPDQLCVRCFVKKSKIHLKKKIGARKATYSNKSLRTQWPLTADSLLLAALLLPPDRRHSRIVHVTYRYVRTINYKIFILCSKNKREKISSINGLLILFIVLNFTHLSLDRICCLAGCIICLSI